MTGEHPAAVAPTTNHATGTYKCGPMVLMPAAVSSISVDVICATQGALSVAKTRHAMIARILWTRRTLR